MMTQATHSIPKYAPPQDYPCQVLLNRDCGTGLKLLRLQLPEQAAFSCQPGQFVMLDLPDSRFYFRRPFSVLTAREAGNFDIYYKIVGTGTQIMETVLPGDTLRCLGPLGFGFTPPVQPETALYIGGGIGIAPLYFLAQKMPVAGTCFYGVRSSAEIGLGQELETLFGKNLHVATDNGSTGFHGNICQLLTQHTEKIRHAKEAYICGPTRMMEATAELLYQINPEIMIQVSLEEHMPCGTGACTGCVITRTDQYLPSKVCVEGPVFNARSINWKGEQRPYQDFCSTGEGSSCLS